MAGIDGLAVSIDRLGGVGVPKRFGDILGNEPRLTVTIVNDADREAVKVGRSIDDSGLCDLRLYRVHDHAPAR